MPKVFKPNLAKATTTKKNVLNSPLPYLKSPSINEYLLSPRKRSELTSPRDLENSPFIQYEESYDNCLKSPDNVPNEPLKPNLSPRNKTLDSLDLNASIVSLELPKSTGHDSSNVDLDTQIDKQKSKRKNKVLEFENITDTTNLTMKDIVNMIPKSSIPKSKKNPIQLDDKNDTKEIDQKTEDTLDLKKARALEPSYTIDDDGNIVINNVDNKITVEDLIENSKKTSKMVIEDDILNMKSSVYAYRKNPIIRSKVWSKGETFTFYRALSTFGQDFSLIQHLFPNRNHLEIKRKFKSEEKRNPHLINNILRNPKSYDLTAFYLDDVEVEVEEKKNRKKLPVARAPKVKKPKKEVVDSTDENYAARDVKKYATPQRRSLRHLNSCLPSPKNLAEFVSKE